MQHRHICPVCRDSWWHEADEDDCLGVSHRRCPICEDGGEPPAWWESRRGLTD
jgi:hypothetical protein